MPRPQRHYSVDEYFAIEQNSEIRHEYYDGEIFAMSGGSQNHNEIALNLRSALHAALRSRGCRSFVADIRLRAPGGQYTFPDVMVICGEAQVTKDPIETVTNPVVLAEVLSPSTQEFDREEKFDIYRTIPTLRDYLLVDQYGISIEHRWLDGAEWKSERFQKREDEITLRGVPAVIRVAAVYETIDFETAANQRTID